MRKKFEHSLRPSGTHLTFRQQSLFKTPSLIEEIENFLIDKPTLSKNIELHALPKPMRRKFGHSLLPPRTNLSSWNNDVDSTMFYFQSLNTWKIISRHKLFIFPMSNKFKQSLRWPGTNVMLCVARRLFSIILRHKSGFILPFRKRCLFKRPSIVQDLEDFFSSINLLSPKTTKLQALPQTIRRQIWAITSGHLEQIWPLGNYVHSKYPQLIEELENFSDH